MPSCRDERYHKTQGEADACKKHPSDTEFDNLSTVSRKHPRRRRPRRKAASPSQRSDSSDAPPTAPPPPASGPVVSPSTASERLVDRPDDEIDQPTSPNMAPPPLVPPQSAQTGMYPAAGSVEDWINNVAKNPGPVPQDDIGDDDHHTLPPPVVIMCGGAPPPGLVPPDNGPHTPPVQLDPGGEDGTPPGVRRILDTIEGRGGRATAGGGDGDGSPTPGPRPPVSKLPPIEDYHPWFANWRFLVTPTAALILGLLLAILVLAGGNRDAKRFP